MLSSWRQHILLWPGHNGTTIWTFSKIRPCHSCNLYISKLARYIRTMWVPNIFETYSETFGIWLHCNSLLLIQVLIWIVIKIWLWADVICYGVWLQVCSEQKSKGFYAKGKRLRNISKSTRQNDFNILMWTFSFHFVSYSNGRHLAGIYNVHPSKSKECKPDSSVPFHSTELSSDLPGEVVDVYCSEGGKRN